MHTLIKNYFCWVIFILTGLILSACSAAPKIQSTQPPIIIAAEPKPIKLAMVEGKFKFKITSANKQSTTQGSGLFTWQQHKNNKFNDNDINIGWLLQLKTPIYTNIASIIQGLDIQQFNDDIYKPIYQWKDLPFIQQGMTLSAYTFEHIMLNIDKPDILQKIIEKESWFLSEYLEKESTLYIRLTQNNIQNNTKENYTTQELTLMILK